VPYHAIVDVILHEGVVHMRWTFADGGQTYAAGFVKDGRLVVGYYGQGMPPGVAVYYVKPGKPLEGAWVTVTASGRYRETLTRRSAENEPRPAAQQLNRV
jgi:hypothetical protein